MNARRCRAAAYTGMTCEVGHASCGRWHFFAMTTKATQWRAKPMYTDKGTIRLSCCCCEYDAACDARNTCGFGTYIAYIHTSHVRMQTYTYRINITLTHRCAPHRIRCHRLIATNMAGYIDPASLPIITPTRTSTSHTTTPHTSGDDSDIESSSTTDEEEEDATPPLMRVPSAVRRRTRLQAHASYADMAKLIRDQERDAVLRDQALYEALIRTRE